jgi:hypothetical protein
MRSAFSKFLVAFLVNPFAFVCHGDAPMNWFPETGKNRQNDYFRRRGIRKAPRADGPPAVGGAGHPDSRVLAAMRRVPRHEFVPVDFAGSAYEDNALP